VHETCGRGCAIAFKKAFARGCRPWQHPLQRQVRTWRQEECGRVRRDQRQRCERVHALVRHRRLPRPRQGVPFTSHKAAQSAKEQEKSLAKKASWPLRFSKEPMSKQIRLQANGARLGKKCLSLVPQHRHTTPKVYRRSVRVPLRLLCLFFSFCTTTGLASSWMARMVPAAPR
jgi:hypothetical protein